MRVLYIFTFPLNNVGVDTSNYYYMLINGTTSLSHASGYPFLIGSIARFLLGRVKFPRQPIRSQFLPHSTRSK